MATTKKETKFYADTRVTERLEAIPKQLRSNWINTVLLAHIEADQSGTANGGGKSDLQKLHAWLKKRNKDTDTFEGALCDTLNEFYKKG